MSRSPITIFAAEIGTFGGAERGIIGLSRWLYERSLLHRFLLYRDQIGLAQYADHPIDVVTLSPGASPVSKVSALRRYFRDTPNDAPSPLMSGIQAALHASLAGVRGFHTLMHDTPSLLSDGANEPAIKNMLRRIVSDRVLAHGLNSGGTTLVHSAYLKDESVRLWNPPVIIARTGGVAGKSFRPRIVGQQLRMLSVSRIESNKRIDWILRSLAELERRKPALRERIDWRLDVVGEGTQIGELRLLAEKLGLGERVTFHGFVNDTRLIELYERSDLFLMPARQGYGLPAAEALAQGIPVLLHRESGISDILGDTPWAVVMDGGEDSVAAALDCSIVALLQGKHIGVPPPNVPTQDAWAEQVARTCGWYQRDAG